MNKKQQPFFNPELSGFCSQMAMILHSGISPLEGITIMLEDSTSDREKDILQQILDTLQETADFSLSLKETGLFPSYLVHMVQIGEETGTLDEVMSALSTGRQYRKKHPQRCDLPDDHDRYDACRHSGTSRKSHADL